MAMLNNQMVIYYGILYICMKMKPMTMKLDLGTFFHIQQGISTTKGKPGYPQDWFAKCSRCTGEIQQPRTGNELLVGAMIVDTLC